MRPKRHDSYQQDTQILKRLWNKAAHITKTNGMIKCDRELLVKSVIISSIANGVSRIRNADVSDSAAYAAIEAVRRLGVTVKIDGDVLTVYGKGKRLSPKHNEIDIRGYDDLLFLLAPIAANCENSVSIVNVGERTYLNDYVESLKKYGIKISASEEKITVSPSEVNLESVMLSVDGKYLYDSILIASLYSSSKSIIYARSNMYNTTLLLLEAMRYEYKKKNYIIVSKDIELSPIGIYIGKNANEVAASVRNEKAGSFHFSSVRADAVAMEAIRELPQSEYTITVKYLNNGYFPLADIDIVRVKG